MAIQLLVAKVLRDELSLRGIRSLSAEESEAIAARIFARITELELELAARDFTSSRAVTTGQRDGPSVCPFTIHYGGSWSAKQRKRSGSRYRKLKKFPGGRYRRQPTGAWWGNESSLGVAAVGPAFGGGPGQASVAGTRKISRTALAASIAVWKPSGSPQPLAMVSR
jgi:hypothetical protein